MLTYNQVDLKNFRNAIQNEKKRLKTFRRNYIYGIIDFIIAKSPVDTGAFMESWGLGNTGSPREGESSRGRPRNRSKTPYVNKARTRMRSDYFRLADKSRVRFENNAPHSGRVEYMGWNGVPPYRIFSKLNRARAGIVARARKQTYGT